MVKINFEEDTTDKLYKYTQEKKPSSICQKQFRSQIFSAGQTVAYFIYALPMCYMFQVFPLHLSM